MSRKKQIREKKSSIEDIYRNKHFVPPKEQNLETIFEEPRQSKDGVPILTSVKKYKRYLHFDPTQNKIQKRKRKAKKCLKKMKTNYRITRSSPENFKCSDISLYILNALGDSSNDSDLGVINTTQNKPLTNALIATDQSPTLESYPASSTRDLSCPDLCNTPKRSYDVPRPHKLQQFDKDSEKDTDIVNDNSGEATVNTSYDDAQNSTIKNDDANQTLGSPRRSCCIS